MQAVAELKDKSPLSAYRELVDEYYSSMRGVTEDVLRSAENNLNCLDKVVNAAEIFKTQLEQVADRPEVMGNPSELALIESAKTEYRGALDSLRSVQAKAQQSGTVNESEYAYVVTRLTGVRQAIRMVMIVHYGHHIDAIASLPKIQSIS